MRFACMLDWITHAGSGNPDPCGLPSPFGPEKPASSPFNQQLQTNLTAYLAQEDTESKVTFLKI